MTFNLIPSLLLALFLQTPKPAPGPAPKASISGTVVHSTTGSPVANVKVTLAKTDVPDSVTRYLSEMTGRGEGLPFPAMETTLPAEYFERMQAEMAAALATPNNRPLPPEAAILKALPLDSLHSVMMSADGKVGFVPKSAPPIVTDGGGGFTFQGLDPGTYRLIFASNGFVRQDYGQLTVGSGGTPIVVTAGKAIGNVVMRLIPTGSISGRVTDTTGQPVALVPVQIARIGYDASGKKHTKAVASAQTDDRGEYRLYFVSPGRYYLSAGGNSSGMPAWGPEGFGPYPVGSDVFYGPAGEFAGDFGGFGVPSTMNRIVQNFGQSFYPRGADVTTATPVDVAPGSELSGVDVTVNIQGLFTVRGTILDGSERPVPMASVNLLPAEGYPLGAEALLSVGFGFDGSGNTTSGNGTFELRKVRPGSYTVMAQSNDFNPESMFLEQERAISALPPAEQEKFYMEMEVKMMAAAAETPRATATITVGNGDLEGVTLRMVKGVKVTGRVRVDPDASGRPPAIERLRVQLVGAVAMPFGLYGPYGIESQQPVKPDGAFDILGLLPGEYQVAVSGIPAGYYVKSARYGEVDALNNALTLPTEKPGTLEVVLSPGLGQLEGTVTGENGRSAAGAQLVLIPDRNRARTELFRPVIVDSSSRFSLQNVTPGDYHLVAWEAIDPFEFFDPALIAQAEEKGRAVRVGESSRQTVDVRVLPRP